MDLIGGVQWHHLVKVTFELRKGCTQSLQGDNLVNRIITDLHRTTVSFSPNAYVPQSRLGEYIPKQKVDRYVLV